MTAATRKIPLVGEVNLTRELEEWLNFEHYDFGKELSDAERTLVDGLVTLSADKVGVTLRSDGPLVYWVL